MTPQADRLNARWGALAASLRAAPSSAAGNPWPGRAIGLLLVLAVAACPFYAGEFKVGLIGLGLVYGLFAFGLDIAWGRAGIVSIGHAVFFGLGAYGVGIALARHGSPILGGAAGVAVAAVLGAAIAAAGLRRAANPATMAVLTLAITLLAEKIAIAWTPVTGGSNGLFIPMPASTRGYFWICLAVAAAVVLVVWLAVLRRPLGNRLVAIRLNERRAEHLGIPIYRERVLAFALSAVVAAIAGAFAAPWLTSVSPDQVGIVLSTQVLVWVAIGGRSTIVGPFFGAVLATYGGDALAGSIGSYYLLLLGVLFVLCVVLMPSGLIGLVRAEPNLADTTPPPAPAAAGPPQSTGEALAARDIVKRFAGNRVLDGVDLVVQPGEIVCLIGPNGAGKTTLLNVLSGAITADGGTVTIGGQRVEQAAPDRRSAAGLARTFQVPSLFPGLSVADHFVLARQQAGKAVPLAGGYDRLEGSLGALPVEALSLSDRRSLEIAMAMCARPTVLLLDEPAAGLAFQESHGLVDMLHAMRRDIGCAIVCVEHDMEIVRSLADRVVCLHHGRVLSAGTMAEVSADPEVRRAYLGLA